MMLSGWAHLPAEIVQELASTLGGADSERFAQAKTLLRLCCHDWRQALPLGHSLPAKVWAWAPNMTTALAPHVRDLHVLSPQPTNLGPASPLPHLAACPRLRSLTLCHVAPAALEDALEPLTLLTSLNVTVHWELAQRGWLDFAAGLTCLQELSVTAAVIRLNPECGLRVLAGPLRRSLRRLRLTNCVLPGDLSAPSLAALSGLEALSLVPCAMGQAGMDQLGSALTRLQQLEIRVQDGVDPSRLLQLPGLTSVKVHMSRLKANDFVAAAGHFVPQANLKRLAVALSGGPSSIFLAAPFQGGAQLRQLEALHLPGIQLAPGVVDRLAEHTRLQELAAELDWTVRSGALRNWTALTALRTLRLRCNFYLRDEDWHAILAGLPCIQDLSMESMQGSGGALRPLRHATALTRLRLTSCHFESGALLGESLVGVVLPGERDTAPGLASLHLDGCGVQSAVVGAVITALGGRSAVSAPLAVGAGRQLEAQRAGQQPLPGAGAGEGGEGGEGGSSGASEDGEVHRAGPVLRELRLELKWRVGNESARALAAAIAACTQLSVLDVHFPALSDPQATVPAWAALTSLSGLRSLHVCSGLGWGAAALRALAGAAPRLREVALTDNQGAVGDEWLAALGALRQLSRLELNSCGRLSEAGAVEELRQLSGLTSLHTYRCAGITSVRVAEELKAALPCLAVISLRE